MSKFLQLETRIYFRSKNILIVIKDYLTDGIDLENNGAYNRIRPQRIGALPGQVEPDIMRTIQFLPGVVSTDGSASSVHIRGGTPDQNLILWEDIPIYHSAHYFGMLSAFNPFIIDKMDVHRGGFDAEYGGRISGVIDLKSEDYTLRKSNFGVGANFVNVFAQGGISLLDNKASVIFSLRRSIADLIKTPTFENINRRVHQGFLFEPLSLNKIPDGIRIIDEFNYLDGNLKFSYKVSPKDELTVSGFFNTNDFTSLIMDENRMGEQIDSFYLKNNGVNISWNHQWNSNFSTKVMGVFTDYKYDYDYSVTTFNQNNKDKSGEKSSAIQEQQFHLINTYRTSSNSLIKLGYQLSNFDVEFKIDRRTQDDQQINEDLTIQSKIHTVYGTFGTDNSKRLGVNFGLRANHFEIKKSTHLEPRVRLWYRLNENWKVYANSGKYFQFLSQIVEIQGDQASIQTPVWALAGGNEVPILEAIQHQLGMLFDKDNWVIDFQVYAKNIDGLTSLATGFTEDLQGKYRLGEAKIRGFDILLKKRWNNYRTWMSYSRTATEYRFNKFFDQNFSPENHIPHSFHWVHVLKKDEWEFSLGWKIASGSPYSNRDNFEVVMEQNGGPKQSIRPIINEFNDLRLTAQHQLDASITYTLAPNQKRNWNGTFGVSLFNIYNQRNIYQRALFMEVRPNENPRLVYTNKTDLGFTPNVLVKFDF